GVAIVAALPLIAGFIATGAGPSVLFLFPSAVQRLVALAAIALVLIALVLIVLELVSTALVLVAARLILAARVAHVITGLTDRVVCVIRLISALSIQIPAGLVLIPSRLIRIVGAVLIGLAKALRSLLSRSLARLSGARLVVLRRRRLAGLIQLRLTTFC